jgi:hypothetical protein
VCVQGAGTDESTLIEILLTRTNAMIKEMKEEYPDGEDDGQLIMGRIRRGQNSQCPG